MLFRVVRRHFISVCWHSDISLSVKWRDITQTLTRTSSALVQFIVMWSLACHWNFEHRTSVVLNKIMEKKFDAKAPKFDQYNSQFLRKLEGNRIILTVPARRGLNSIRQDITFIESLTRR